MNDEALDLTRDLKAWRVPVEKGTAEGVADRLVKEARGRALDVLILDAELVFGLDHLRSALYHARKAVSERRNVSDSISMETLLYASGERQLSAAIRKMSPNDDTTELVVAQLGPGEMTPPPEWLELRPMVDRPSAEALARFGISETELQTCARDRIADLVLEKVAAVDVLKR